MNSLLIKQQLAAPKNVILLEIFKQAETYVISITGRPKMHVFLRKGAAPYTWFSRKPSTEPDLERSFQSKAAPH
jgi:hypothetical protein